jgi:hypothetical protein
MTPLSIANTENWFILMAFQIEKPGAEVSDERIGFSWQVDS